MAGENEADYFRRSNLQLLPLALQLQFTLNGPAFRATQRCHHMGFFPLLLLQVKLIHTCGELSVMFL
ncbi:hypothetical protein ZWY2020_025969 [Hordeum vulgare]|nr:hypothetical protein ZWY2020_025969 [Hordeum vulgare]